MEKNKAAQEMARLRILSQTPERRKEIASKAGSASAKSMPYEQLREKMRKAAKASALARAKKD